MTAIFTMASFIEISPFMASLGNLRNFVNFIFQGRHIIKSLDSYQGTIDVKSHRVEL